MPAMPAEWWLRPVKNACRVAEQIAVVWKRLYFRPPGASFVGFGVRQGPPNAVVEPNPASSISTSRTLGAPLGGLNCSMGTIFVSGSFASYVIRPGRAVFGIGRWERCFLSALIKYLLLYFEESLHTKAQ